MKLGDLVLYVEGGRPEGYDQMGLILSGPSNRPDTEGGNRWEVYWMYCNKIGWWDEFRLEVIDEAR